jgi:hypothetical protein
MQRDSQSHARDGQRAVDHALELGEVSQLVVPLHPLAKHRRLVEGLLGPVDLAIASSGQRALGEGSAAGRHEDRHVGARRVDDAPQRIRAAHDDMHHHRLRPAGDHGTAVGHGDSRHLMRYRDRARPHMPFGETLGVGLDEGREVGAGVGEEVVGATSGQKLEIRLGRALDADALGHDRSPGLVMVSLRLGFSPGHARTLSEVLSSGGASASLPLPGDPVQGSGGRLM